MAFLKLNFRKAMDSIVEFIAIARRALREVCTTHKKVLVQLLVISLLVAISPFVTQGVFALILNHLAGQSAMQSISLGLIMLIVFVAISYSYKGSLYVFMNYKRRIAWFDLRQRYDLALSEKMVSLDVATHEDPKFQDNYQVVQEYGSSFVMTNFIENLVMNVQNVVAFCIASAVVFMTDWRLFILILIACSPRFYTEFRYGRGIWSIYQSHSEDRRRYLEFQRPTRSITGIRELQTFQTKDYFIDGQRRLLENFFGDQKKEERRKMNLAMVSQVGLMVAIAITLYILVGRVISGALQIGTFTFVFGSVRSLQDAVSGFFLSLASQYRDSRPVKAFLDILDRESIIKNPEKGLLIKTQLAPIIELRNVSFAYPSKPERSVLNNVSFQIRSGDRVALVGVNGSGKSTIVNLLCRFYDPTGGVILVNGRDLRDIDLNDWYGKLALLSQDFETYRLKTWELINLGRLNGDRNQEQIKRAAQLAKSDSFIEKWDMKYDQQIGVEFTEGVNPSKGQRQKLALSRSFYRNASIMILDEPTAHIDAEAEEEIFQLLDQNIRPDQSLILISHRFSTVRIATKIIVLGEDGSVCEKGDHYELLKKNGRYADLFNAQASGYR